MDQEIAFHLHAAVSGFDVVAFSARERVFTPFVIQLDLVSHKSDIALHDLIDTDCALEITDKYDATRWLHGVVSDAGRGESTFHRTTYTLTLKPTLHRLQHGSDSRIWQSKTVPDIVTEIFDQYGVVEVEWRLSETHLPREYCVQYQETHFDFVHRLLAEEGIYYFFTHSQGGHRLILTDAPLASKPAPHAARIEHMSDVGDDYKTRWVTRFVQRERVRATSFAMKDYTFKQPSYGQDHRAQAQEINGTKQPYDLYDYPGRYKGPGAGKPFTQYRMESVRTDASTGSGMTNKIHLSPGHRFELAGHTDAAANIDHFIVSVDHGGQQPVALEEAAPEASTSYSASFATMPARLPYRPTNPQPKPHVLGSQIATVVGPAGEEIYCDDFGRIKVQFPWDRYGASDEHSSCWIRVAQSSGGGTWGHVAIPRIGNEVVVDFLEGDPDQPVVLGMTFNAANMPPYKLPGHKTKMALRSQSHKAPGHSEISFEDEAGREDLFVHAQKDHTIKVLNNQNANIQANRVENIGANASTAIAANMMERVGANKHISVGGSGLGLIQMLMPLVMAGGKLFKKGAQKAGAGGVVTYAGDVAGVADLPKELAAIMMKGDFGGSGGHRGEAGAAQHGAAAGMASLLNLIMPSSGTMSTTIEKFKKETVGQGSTEQVGIAKNTLVGNVMTTSVGKLMKTKVGEDIDIEAKKSIFARTAKHTLHAKDKFVIGGPGGTIIIDKSGITIKAKSVKIKSPSVDFSSGSPDQVDALKSDKPFVQECKGK